MRVTDHQVNWTDEDFDRAWDTIRWQQQYRRHVRRVALLRCLGALTLAAAAAMVITLLW